MAGKIYFIFITLFVLFTNRYQYVTASHYGVFEYLFLLRDGLLLFAGFSYFFHKNVLDKTHWKYVWWFMIVQLVVSVIKQILPGSYYGDLEDGQIGANIFALLISVSLFIPLYIASYRLQLQQAVKKVKKR